jgi:hypothetical protein
VQGVESNDVVVDIVDAADHDGGVVVISEKIRSLNDNNDGSCRLSIANNTRRKYSRFLVLLLESDERCTCIIVICHGRQIQNWMDSILLLHHHRRIIFFNIHCRLYAMLYMMVDRCHVEMMRGAHHRNSSW